MKMNKKTLRILEIIAASLLTICLLRNIYYLFAYFFFDWYIILALIYDVSYILIIVGLFARKKIIDTIGIGTLLLSFILETLIYREFYLSILFEIALFAILLVLNILYLKDKKPNKTTKIIFLVALAVLAFIDCILPTINGLPGLKYAIANIIPLLINPASIILLCIITYFHYIQGKDEEKKKENKQVEIPVDHSINSIAGCAEKLQRIKQLLDTDAISKSEFDKLKKEIIDKFKNI